MKKLILIIPVLTITLFGCKNYFQVIDIGSEDVKVNNEDFYVYENDTIQITYFFWTNQGVLSFRIYNKMEVPIYIDWKKSSYISNSTKLNYWIDKETRTSYAIYSGYSKYLYKGLITNWGTIQSNEETTKEERITFIPPKSNYIRSQFRLLPIRYYPIKKSDNFVTVPRNDKPYKKRAKVYKMTFNKANSPIYFRNFITYSLTENFKKELYVDNDFFVTNIKEMVRAHFVGKMVNINEYEYTYEYPYRKPTAFYLDFYIKEIADKDVIIKSW